MTSITRHESWSEHQTTMFSSLHEKQKQGKFCDVLLKCCDSEQTFNAHSCVLSAASGVLDKILNETMENAVPGTTKLLVVLPNEVTSSCMDSLLNFIYSGNIDLNLKKPNASGSGTATRKSKRKLLKTKVSEGSDADETSPDIPLLYAFLKASRRLQIQTLTEHLESAVTLSEMKMCDARDASAVEETPVVKNGPSPKPTLAPDQNIESRANHSLRKVANVDQNINAASKLKSPSRRKRGRLPEKVASQETNIANSKAEHCSDEAISTVTPNQIPDGPKGIDAGNQSTPVIVSAPIPEIKEVDEAVTSLPKTRVIRRMQCPTCQQIFRNADTYEAHMKDHINEIEIALSKNKQENHPHEDTNNVTIATDSKNTSEAVAISTNKLDNNCRTSERPKRASTAKFHEMMKSTFGADHHVVIPTIKERIDSTISVGANEDDGEMHSLVLTAVNESTLLVNAMEDEGCVQQIVIQGVTGAEELVDMEPDKTVWHTVDNEIVPTMIKGDATEMMTEDEADIISLVPVEDDVNVDVIETKSKVKGKKKREKSNTFNDDSQICTFCGKTVSNMKAHLRTHARTLPCRICGETFKYRSALTRHMQFHSEGLSCSACGEKVFSQRDMTKHMAKHNHKKMRTECPDCKKTFTSEYVMQLHRRTHTGEEKFACNICSKRFPYKSSLKMHMLLHTGEKPYICSICGKCFVQKIHAKEHELQHQGIKRQFQCSICEKNFAHKCGLTRHVADIHNKSRPFVCDTCGKSFPRKTKLVEHKRMHTGEKPYICDICGMRYKANRSLKLHKKEEHGILVANYQVGIWRNGPVPPDPKSERRKAVSKRKTKPITVPKDIYNANLRATFATKSLRSFPFPVSLQDVDIAEGEENIITDVSEHVTIMSCGQNAGQTFTTSDAKAAQHFSYPIPQTNQTFSGQFTTLAEVSSYTTQALPPASTLTKSDPSSALDYPTFSAHKTFIVPLTSSAHPSVPVVVDPNPSQIDQSQVPGMMVTYMMPPQPYTMTEASPVTNVVTSDLLAAHLPDATRSASVPPMSTFSRSSNVTTVLKRSSPIQALPGMHTFQPGSQFRVTPTDINTEMIEIESQADVPIIVDAQQHILPMSPAEEVPALAGEVTVVQQQRDEWTDDYSN